MARRSLGAIALILLLAHGTSAGRVLQQDVTSTPTPLVSVGSAFTAEDANYFLRVTNGRFEVNCKEWFMNGFNLWETVEAATGALQLYGSTLPGSMPGPEFVRSAMDAAVASGANTLRVWTSPVSDQYALETSPGVFDEAVLRGLDYVLDQARLRGLRVVLILMDNWQPGGVDTLVGWAGQTQHEAFWSNSEAQGYYRERVQKIVTRINAINGRPYSQDPTIAAWNLMNEPRCYQCSTDVQTWIQTMAAYVKSLDSNHLLTVGEEGFYASGGGARSAANPMGAASWSATEGQDFVKDHASSDIDYATTHLWPDNWRDTSASFISLWLKTHLADAKAMGKPIVLEEFGLYRDANAVSTTSRDVFFKTCYDAILGANTTSGGAGAGALFFQYYIPGQVAPTSEGAGQYGQFGVYEGDASTWELHRRFSSALAAGQGAPVASCPSPAASSAPAVRDCTSTRVDGAEGTGYEGPRCDVDIDECLRGTDRCSANAGCLNTEGSYTCTCYAGYAGDGFSCVETSELQAIQANYTTDGSGLIACDQGQDVPYPQNAPGWRANPFDRSASIYGSRIAVSLLGCQQACAVADGCDSFSYNPSLQMCFLKKLGSSNTCTSSASVCSASDTSSGCAPWQSYFGPNRDSRPTSAYTPAATPTSPPSPPAITSASPYAPGSFTMDIMNALLGRRRRRLASEEGST